MYAFQRLRESVKRALRLSYRITVARLPRTSRTEGNRSTGTPPIPIELRPLPDLGYDDSTIDWADRLLRNGDPTAPFPPADPLESQSDEIRLRGIYAYLSRLTDYVDPGVIETRLARLLQFAIRAINRNPVIGWDTTNAALRLLSLLEGIEHLARAGRLSAVNTLLPERFMEAHRRVLLGGAFIEPRGNHEALKCVGLRGDRKSVV